MMECPSCHSEIPSRQCPQCGENTPDFGKFCCHCAAPLPRVDLGEEFATDPDDFSSRILCSDGACIGVINEQGVCNECGRAYSGEPE
jgi:hypothetical protein